VPAGDVDVLIRRGAHASRRQVQTSPTPTPIAELEAAFQEHRELAITAPEMVREYLLQRIGVGGDALNQLKRRPIPPKKIVETWRKVLTEPGIDSRTGLLLTRLGYKSKGRAPPGRRL
jgi:hypothetical protein